MSALDQLKKILQDSTPRSARVVGIKRGKVLVSVGKGIIEARRDPSDVTAYAVGDRVIIESGIVKGRARTGEIYWL